MRDRLGIVVLSLLLCAGAPASAQVSIGIGLPNVSIAIDLPSYPQLARVPGYPVYYAPGLMSNYFFYDGMYWVYQDENWYASSWYNGPWGQVAPDVVPLFLLRVPVSYYRRPPAFFRGWRPDSPPHWGERWGHEWERRRPGLDRWNRASVPARAPLPSYQLHYRADRYPRVEQQRALRSENYSYRPRERVVRQHYDARAAQVAPASARRSPATSPRGNEVRDRGRAPGNDHDKGNDRSRDRK